MLPNHYHFNLLHQAGGGRWKILRGCVNIWVRELSYKFGWILQHLSYFVVNVLIWKTKLWKTQKYGKCHVKFQFFDHKTVILDRKKFGLSAYENLTLYRTMRILSVPIVPIQKCFNLLCTTQITASAISKILVMKKKT